jgi:hypothetical protein
LGNEENKAAVFTENSDDEDEMIERPAGASKDVQESSIKSMTSEIKS